jgi:hypothetical protein
MMTVQSRWQQERKQHQDAEVQLGLACGLVDVQGAEHHQRDGNRNARDAGATRKPTPSQRQALSPAYRDDRTTTSKATTLG